MPENARCAFGCEMMAEKEVISQHHLRLHARI